MAITTIDIGDELVLALEQEDTSAGRQNIIIVRIPNADTCITSNRHFLAEGAAPCPSTTSYPHESLWFEHQGEENYAIESPDHYAYQPVLFTGNTYGQLDRRVGLVFYVQPHRGDESASEAEQRFTTLIGLVSYDGGQTWGPGSGLTVPVEGRPTIYEDMYASHSGTVFIPCPSTSGYFGDYNGGGFAADVDDPEQWHLAVAAWADSREGCFSQNEICATFHQKVFSVRFSPRANP